MFLTETQVLQDFEKEKNVMWKINCESDVKVKLFQTISKYGDNQGKIFHIWVLNESLILLQLHTYFLFG